MVHILIEENYADNNRIDQILQGMASIIKKKRIGVKLYTDISKLEKNARVVVLLCASLKWATDTIEVLNAAGIHPLLFGFQYMTRCMNTAVSRRLIRRQCICLQVICFRVFRGKLRF